MKVRLKNVLQHLANTKSGVSQDIDERVFGRKLGLITRLIGCPHKDVGRPFVEGQTAYRSCSSCGARKQFNTATFETHKNFYSAPVSRPRVLS